MTPTTGVTETLDVELDVDVDVDEVDVEGPCALGGIEPVWNWCLACQAGHPEDCAVVDHEGPRWLA